MPSDQPLSHPAFGEDAPSDQLLVNLQIVSPSAGVTRPLLYPGLSAATTIKQLKGKIRDSLPLRPADEHQRLIHRGRALLRDTDSLLDIIGADALRTQPDQHTIHLVLRDVAQAQPPLNTSTASGQSPAPVGQAQNAPRPTPTGSAFAPQQSLPGLTRRTPFQTASPLVPPRGPSPVTNSHAPAATAEQVAAFQQQHQNMTSWLTQVQREAEARTRALINQNQRGRAVLGMRGIGDTAPSNEGHGSESNSGRASPVLPVSQVPGVSSISSQAVPGHREPFRQNGNTFHVEAYYRTFAVPPSTVPVSAAAHASAHATPPTAAPTSVNPAEIRNFFRAVDANHAVGANNILHRSASNPSLQSRPLSQPAGLPSVLATGGSRTSTGRATPDYNLRPPTAGPAGSTASFTGTSHPQAHARPSIDIYLLSSPEGPRALVFNNASSETYYTPRIPAHTYPQYSRHLGAIPATSVALPSVIQDDAQHLSPLLRAHYLAQNQQPFYQQHHFQQQPLQPLQPLQQQQQQQQQRQQQQQTQQEHQRRQMQQAQPHAQQPRNQRQAAIAFHPNNPVAGAVPALLLQILPHFWLIIRLALFVWLFAYPTNSWSRWFTVISLAVFVFALSTGILNGVAEHAWRPLGRHLENVFPAAEYARLHRGRENGQAQRADVGEGDQQHNPDPTQMAARLVAEHRERPSWLLGHARSVERAFLLFVASIAPGIAERHIANLEAEARAEEARRREAEEARRREAEAAAASTAATEAATPTATATVTTEERNRAQSTGVDAFRASGDEGVRQRHAGDEQREHHNGPAQEDLIAF